MRGVTYFFVWVIITSVPFWVVGGLSPWQPVPGVPLSALMVILPAIVAVCIYIRTYGFANTVQWIGDTLRINQLARIRWVAASTLLPPATLTVAYLVMRAGGYALPESEADVLGFIVLVGIFLIPALLEELGWSGYALVELQKRVSALNASVIIGVIWAVWHLVPLYQVGRSPSWIIGWFVVTVCLRILITWVFNNAGGSTLLAGLLHASANASWQCFPVRGSHYDPAIHAVVLCAISIAVTLAFGTRTLTREIRRSSDSNLS